MVPNHPIQAQEQQIQHDLPITKESSTLHN